MVPLGRFERIDQQHRDRHRADPPGHLAHGVEIGIAAKFALFGSVGTDIDDDRARLDHVGRQHVPPADRRDDDIGQASVRREVGRCTVADGDRGMGLQEQEGHRLADRVAPADHDRMLAADLDAGALDQLQATPGRRGTKTVQPRHQPAGGQHREAVDILARRDGLDHAVRIDVRRQGQLHQDAVDGRIGVQGRDAGQQLGLGQVRRVLFEHRMQTVFLAGPHLVAHVDGTRRVVADDDHRQARAVAARGQGSRPAMDIRANGLGEPGAVDQLSSHRASSSGTEKAAGKAAFGCSPAFDRDRYGAEARRLRPLPARRARS